VKKVLASFTLVAVLAGCAHVQPVGGPQGLDVADLNEKLSGRMALVRLADGTELLAHDVTVSGDSVSLRRERSPGDSSPWPERTPRVLPISEVDSIVVERTGRGALEGALAGFGAGALVGAGMGAAAFEPSGGDLLITSAGDAAVLGALFGGMLGTGAGLLIGASVGSSDVYDLEGVSEGADSLSYSEAGGTGTSPPRD
jgi:hypothetical protein